MVMKFEDDWEFFFSERFFDNFNFVKFSCCLKLSQEFRSITKRSLILETLSSFNTTNRPTQDIIEEILDNVYLTNFFPSATGLSTYNFFIFISTIRGISDLESTYTCRAVIYIILLHELAHVLRRYNCKTL